MRLLRTSALVFAVFLPAASTSCAARAPQGEPEATITPPSRPLVTVKALLDAPARHRDQPFRVAGTLANLGTNYFTDQRIVLRDADGRTIPVRPWLPMEMPKGPPGAPKRGEVLSDYLGKSVVLEATLVRGDMPRLGVVDYLKVERAVVRRRRDHFATLLFGRLRRSGGRFSRTDRLAGARNPEERRRPTDHHRSRCRDGSIPGL